MGKASGGSCIGLIADLSTKAQCKALADKILAKEDKIHILVNNSGVSWGAPMNDFPEGKVLTLLPKSWLWKDSGLLFISDRTRMGQTACFECQGNVLHDRLPRSGLRKGCRWKWRPSPCYKVCHRCSLGHNATNYAKYLALHQRLALLQSLKTPSPLLDLVLTLMRPAKPLVIILRESWLLLWQSSCFFPR